MEERSESSKSGRSRDDRRESGNSRKSKKRNSRKNSVNMESWCEEGPINRNGGVHPPAVDYRQMFWQQHAAPPHVQPHNGQRLFTAMSDPSVCGYSAVPMAYTMEPVSVPPMYPVYQPISRPNYRTYRGRPRRNVAQNTHVALHNSATLTNGYSSLQENRSNYSTPPAYQNGDYASLPPTANNDPINNGEELNSEHRRYSDPGLGPADLAHVPNSDDSDSGESGSSITTIGKNNKLVLSLVEQMTALRESNSQMFKELHETKSDLESMRSDVARLKHGASSDYQPGMLSDIVREMREANRVLDEAMITKVNAMVDEQNRQRTMEFEKLRDQLAKITEEKEDSYRRIAKLEDEVASLKLNSNNEGREIAAFEEENLALRRELQEARASKNLAENHAANWQHGFALNFSLCPLLKTILQRLEKLVEILRKKMNGASNEETVADIRELVSSGLNHATASKLCPTKVEEILRSSSMRIDEEVDGRREEDEDEEEDDDDDEEEEDALSSCDPDSGSSANCNSRNMVSANESVGSNSNTSLTGPVTDL